MEVICLFKTEENNYIVFFSKPVIAEMQVSALLVDYYWDVPTFSTYNEALTFANQQWLDYC